MYLENKQIITAEGIELQLNCETAATQFVSYEGPFGPKYQVICNKCKNSTAEYLCRDDAFNAWNEENK